LRLSHFEQFAPVCPRCRSEDGSEARLTLAEILKGNDERVREGILHCGNESCRQEFPIIDGIPIIVADVRTILAAQANYVNQRSDLDPALVSMMGDSLGDASEFNTRRLHLSIYGWDAYGEFDKEPSSDVSTPGAIGRCLDEGIQLMEPIDGPVIDLGCAAGRSTFDLAQQFDGPVLGVDMSFPMLQLAYQVAESGTASFPLRQVGLVYHEKEIQTPFGETNNVDFWLCDAMALPVQPEMAKTVCALNLLDCVPSPLGLLQVIETLLAPGGQALIGCPYDWASSANQLEQWIGGHSQRGGYEGASEALLRALLTPGQHPQSLNSLKIMGEREDVPWQTRLHARSTTDYRAHLIAVKKSG
jgi:SAM-dependent methyltransferase/uncharacterized protein YbaR (Trm112 family)